jgi:hypothetical protein
MSVYALVHESLAMSHFLDLLQTLTGNQMANSKGDINPAYDNSLSSDFPDWAYDLNPDDDEFRAGYPFSDVSELELSGEEKHRT